jgi:hypothetical protein
MRKTLALLLFSVLLSIHVSAQTFTVEQLKGFNKLTMDEFKKEMKQLKFRFYDRTEGLGFVLPNMIPQTIPQKSESLNTKKKNQKTELNLSLKTRKNTISFSS